MSVHSQFTVTCDGCGKTAQTATSYADARRWGGYADIRPAGEGRDLCEGCREALDRDESGGAS